ncbi:hypothetical protein [Oleiagrimonas sp. C23AA]|uniref:hypothetical protein n=1 Tax=Oleiagrimonas sp. C23AA TaxID=2719047 RepID=UPI00141E3C12|nr:hypothetical protein [Oleiagrimonas sp. C23AA]NII10625.1 hypothetical protein [Oleiagrimonas sp. C23AA]
MMMLIRRKAEVARAKADVRAARQSLHEPLAEFAASARAHPWPWLGGALGLGVVLGWTRQRIWRIPGMLSLLSSEALDQLAAWLPGGDDDTDVPPP